MSFAIFRSPRLPVFAGAFLFATISSAHAGTLLSIDLGTAAQSPFTLWNVGTDGTGLRSTAFSVSDLVSVPGGILTAKFGAGTDATDITNDTASINTRTRPNAPANSGSFTDSNLLTDRVVATGGPSNTGLFLQLSGFAPSTTFSIQVWGYDTQNTPLTGAKPGNFSLYDRTAGADTQLGGFTSVAGTLPTDNNSFSVTGTVTSDANGVIMVESLSNMDGTAIMNGFVVSTVPEPMSGLLLFGGLGIVAVRRRRVAS